MRSKHLAAGRLVLVAVTGAYLWLIGGIAAAAICALNTANFSRTNEIMKIIHTYPLLRLQPREFDPEGLATRFEALLQEGPLPHADAFRGQFAYYREHPMGDTAYADNLELAYKRHAR